MTEFPFKLSEIKLALKRKGLNYKLQNYDLEDCCQESLVFLDVLRGTKLRGKIVRSFNEGEVYHWPLLNHENIAPLLDMLNIRDDLNVFLTSDLPIKLKNIVHEDDFVYDSKCFEKKRAYARGIFSGLSYLHRKSLCLMNLSDENIFICKVPDKAVITNFSSLEFSRRTTRFRLKVCELYRAPETEKGEFDTMTAEIWASGTLMLDLFLAHMVPWAIIDYKPRRILKMVDKLSMELLQAASTGSIVTAVDLAQFKVFLTGFFRENPSMRITARYASTASFLKPKFKESNFRMSLIEKMSRTENKYNTKKRFISYDNSHLSDFFPHQTNEKYDSPSNKNLSKQCLPVKYFDSKQKSNNVVLETPTWLGPDSAAATFNCSKKGERYNCLINTRNTSEKSLLLSYKSESMESIETEMCGEEKTLENVTEKYKLDQMTTKPNHAYSENDNRASGTFSRQKKSSKSCQVVIDGTHILEESSYPCYQSKSLSFINPTADDVKNEISLQLCRSRNCSYSSYKSLPLKLSSSNNWQKSDFCLNRLFEENESNEEAMREKEEVTREVLVRSNLRDRKDSHNLKNASLHGASKQPNQKSRPPSKRNSSDVCSKSDIQHITENIILLRKCQISLHSHLKLFSNEEFVKKQQNLINEYQFLLRQEKIRLYEILRNKYALNISEIIKVIKAVNSRPRHLGMNGKKELPQNTCDTSYELSAFKFGKYMGHNDTVIDAVNYTDKNSKDYSTVPSLRPERRYSYRRAIEMTEKCTDLEKERIMFETENKSKDKLIVKETKWIRNDAGVEDNSKVEAVKTAIHCEQQVLDTKTSKNSSNAKKEIKRMEKNGSRSLHSHRNNEEFRRRFFLSLCPGGKVEESNPLRDDLCETCKLNPKAM